MCEQDLELTFAGYVEDLLAALLIVKDRSHPRLNPIAHGFVQIIEILYLLLAAATPSTEGGSNYPSYFFGRSVPDIRLHAQNMRPIVLQFSPRVV